MSAIIELCDLNGITNFKNFVLSKKLNPDKTYILTKYNLTELQEKTKHNCILSMPGRDTSRRRIFRFSYNISQNENKLDFSRNYIKSIPNKILPNNLEKLNISHNIINKIEDFTSIDKIKYFNCSHNAICNMPELPNTLEEFYINDNNIDKLPESIIQCRNLKKLNYENNKNIKISENVLDFVQEIFERIRQEEERKRQEQEILLRQEERRRQENWNRINNNNNFNNTYYNLETLETVKKKVKKTVNEDSQNVHDIKIRDEVANAIKILIKDKCEMTEEEALNDFGKVIGYEDEDKDENILLYTYNCLGRKIKNIKNIYKVANKSKGWTSNISDNPEEDYKFIEALCSRKSICSKSKVTFGELFRYFWNRIRNSDDRDEILKIFIKSNLPEMRIVCFVGRISRVVNCLNGFFEDISVGISIEQQIQMKYNLVYKKYQNLSNTPLKYNILCYYHFKELLEELKLDDKKMNDWLSPFMEEINDNQGEKFFSTNQLPKEVREKYINDLSNGVFTE